MINHFNSPKLYKLFAVAVLLVLTGISCKPAPVPPSPTPVVQTVEVTREVTYEVTREIVNEVTRIVEVPVTITPTLTPAITYTPSLTPTITPTPRAPIVSILVHAACNYGPGGAYLYKYGLPATVRMEVIGRNLDGTWLYVQSSVGRNPCWVKAEFARFEGGGDVFNYNIQQVYSALPFSNLYQPPQVSTERVGSKVTIYWQPVWMTQDDYEGYLIEAWVCQGGQQVFLPIGYKTSFDRNDSMMAIEITDEPGCLVPSSARIYTAEKHGYTWGRRIPWPPYQSTPTATPTPSPKNPSIP